MIPVSANYVELTKSNIRPKCEPIITVSGVDVNGNDVSVVWRANNIKDLTFKRGIDPIGRELPYMELTWTEIYTGALNKDAYPEKYNNIMQYMLVELEIVQDFYGENLGFWQRVKKYWTWQNLKTKTWQQVKKGNSQETIKMPKMFLVARPVIKDNTITWTARDLLYFFNSSQIKGIGINSIAETAPFFTLLGTLVLGERGAYLGSTPLLTGIKNTALYLAEKEPEYEVNKKMILVGTTKDILLNFSKLKSLYMNFSDDIIKFEQNYIPTQYHIQSNVMYNYPIITNSTNVSQYQFTKHIWEKSEDIKNAQPVSMKWMGVDFIKWFFDGYGIIDESISRPQFWTDVNYAVQLKSSIQGEVLPLGYYPIEDIKTEEFIQISEVGEAFIENNPLWFFDRNSEEIYARAEKIKNYFSSNFASLEFTSLPNLSIEPNDIITVDTNLYDNGEKIAKQGVVTEISIAYNGALKETFKVHEVVL